MEFTRFSLSLTHGRKYTGLQYIERSPQDVGIRTLCTENGRGPENNPRQGEKNQSGQDVNTGRGGRPNRSGRVYDENRNWLGRDNWDNE